MRRSLFGMLAREWKSSAPALSWGRIDELWAGLLGGGYSKSGPAVNWLTSLRVAAVLDCARKIVEAVSTVPWLIYERGAKPASAHPLFALLGDEGPNDFQDSLQFRDTLIIHAVLAGAGRAFINRVRGNITEMIPLLPNRVTVRQASDYSVVYKITAPDGSSEEVSPSEIFEIRGLSWDGFKGLDVIRLAREAIGLSLATEQTHAMLHANGARPSGIVAVKGIADEARLIKLAAWVRRHYGGLDNTSRIMVLDDDAKFTPFDMTGVDSQHIALRQHQIEEICHFMGVLPMVIGHPADMAARAAAETIANMHLVHTVRPWHRRVDMASKRQLLTKAERSDGLYIKLLDGEFLRATAKDRAEYNRVALGGPNNPGWASINDVRDWDDMPDDPSDNADKLWVPTNMITVDRAGQTSTSSSAAPQAPQTGAGKNG